MHKTKRTEWQNELKPTENELKMKICLLTLYLNDFNKSKLVCKDVIKETFLIFVSFFCDIGKLICELQHTFFINLRLSQKLNLWSSALFYKILRSAAGKFAPSAVCGNTGELKIIQFFDLELCYMLSK